MKSLLLMVVLVLSVQAQASPGPYPGLKYNTCYGTSVQSKITKICTANRKSNKYDPDETMYIVLGYKSGKTVLLKEVSHKRTYAVGEQAGGERIYRFSMKAANADFTLKEGAKMVHVYIGDSWDYSVGSGNIKGKLENGDEFSGSIYFGE